MGEIVREERERERKRSAKVCMHSWCERVVDDAHTRPSSYLLADVDDSLLLWDGVPPLGEWQWCVHFAIGTQLRGTGFALCACRSFALVVCVVQRGQRKG